MLPSHTRPIVMWLQGGSFLRVLNGNNHTALFSPFANRVYWSSTCNWSWNVANLCIDQAHKWYQCESTKTSFMSSSSVSLYVFSSSTSYFQEHCEDTSGKPNIQAFLWLSVDQQGFMDRFIKATIRSVEIFFSKTEPSVFSFRKQTGREMEAAMKAAAEPEGDEWLFVCSCEMGMNTDLQILKGGKQ